MIQTDKIITTVLKHYPDVQAIYLFGSFGTDEASPDSDADIAVLLPHEKARQAGSLLMSDLCLELTALLGREVDLINLRQVPTVLQKEVVAADRRIYQADLFAADEFEMLTLSNYQKLNAERAEIIKEASASGRFLNL